jgi:hypothetical protein
VELVLLGDLQSGYSQTWARVANTEGVHDIQIGDRFREQGFGPGAEELEVAGVDISQVGGASRVFVIRAANATQPEVHRLGAVFLQVGIKPKAEATVEVEPILETPGRKVDEVPLSPASTVAPVTAEELGWYPLEPDEAVAIESSLDHNGSNATSHTASVESQTEPLVALKRKRGRPIGSRNKPRVEEVALPAGFD